MKLLARSALYGLITLIFFIYVIISNKQKYFFTETGDAQTPQAITKR